MDSVREALRAKVLEFIRSEVSDNADSLELNTPISQLNIDSIGMIQVIFKFEDAYGVSVDLPESHDFETVGEMIEALVAFIPSDEGKAGA